MARTAQKSRKRAKPDARRRSGGRRDSRQVVEQTLFFTRLRRQARWMFVFLALAFGLGFVFFGVGTGFGGLNDLWQSFASNSSGSSKEELRAQLHKNPDDANAARQLAAAYQQDGDRQQAISVLQTYTAKHPKDTATLSQLASLYIAEGTQQRQRAIRAQTELENIDPSAGVLPVLQSPSGQPVLGANPVTSDIANKTSEQFNQAVANMQGAFGNAVGVYKRIAKVEPKNADVQLQIAQAAQDGQDAQTVAAAFRRFLKLASPQDPRVPVIRKQLKSLERQLSASSSAQSAG